MKTKYTQEQINEMRKMLAIRDIDQIDDSTLFDTFMEGCIGYNNFDDDFIIEHFFNVFDEDDLKK